MLILGIDPGTAATGYGLIEAKNNRATDLIHVAHGCIRTPAGMEMGERLVLLRREIKKLIKTYKPDCLVMEQLFFGQNSKTAMSVGQARGVVIVTAAESRCPFFEYQSLAVKLSLSGYGRSNKKKMQKTVKKILRMKEIPRPDDAADALAVAIYHYEKKEIQV